MRPAAEWIGRRWFEMRVGYGTYMGFVFGFANFILLLHTLTDWFKDYPIHWFGIAAFAVIVPTAVLIGHRHNHTQLKTESRTLVHLHPYNNLMIPGSKEEFNDTHTLAALDVMILTTSDPELKAKCVRLRAVMIRYMDGATATDAMDKEGVHR